jgi:predicted nucleic acid-binding protein
MMSIDASIYAPLIVACGEVFIEAAKRFRFSALNLIVYEVCNAFWKEHTKFKKIERNEAVKACKAAKAATKHMKLYSVESLDATKAIEIALDNNITFYDSAYIALALKTGARMASEDKDIIRVAPRYGVKIVRLQELLRAVGCLEG